MVSFVRLSLSFVRLIRPLTRPRRVFLLASVGLRLPKPSMLPAVSEGEAHVSDVLRLLSWAAKRAAARASSYCSSCCRLEAFRAGENERSYNKGVEKRNENP